MTSGVSPATTRGVPGGEAPEGTASHQGLDPSQWPGGGGGAGGTIYQE